MPKVEQTGEIVVEDANYAEESSDAIKRAATFGAAVGIVGMAVVVGGCAAVGAGVGGVYGYTRHIEYSTMGLKPPPITIKRLKDEEIDGEKRTTIELSNVKIIDVDLIKKVIEEQIEYKDDPKHRVVHDFAKQPTYAVKVILKRSDITVAELDYTSWKDNPDFDVIVTGDNWEVVSDVERDAVLNTLGGVCKFLGDALQNPGAQVEDEMGIASNLKGRFGYVGGIADYLIDAVNDKQTEIEVDPGKPPSEKIETNDFLSDLADVAIRTGNYDILKGYEEAIKGTYEKSILTDKSRANEKLKIATNNP